jgi:hypothetical protein
MGLSLTNAAIDKYFNFLKIFDVKSKKRLILKLNESIEKDINSTVQIDSLFGAWEDKRSANEIIKEVKDSRLDKTDNLEL